MVFKIRFFGNDNPVRFAHDRIAEMMPPRYDIIESDAFNVRTAQVNNFETVHLFPNKSYKFIDVPRKGFFLCSRVKIESIRYKFYSDSYGFINNVPTTNLVKQWCLTAKHIKVLYSALEDILPHEIIHMIEKYCTPEYLYWFSSSLKDCLNDIEKIHGEFSITVNSTQKYDIHILGTKMYIP